jgi:hypothetical protein
MRAPALCHAGPSCDAFSASAKGRTIVVPAAIEEAASQDFYAAPRFGPVIRRNAREISDDGRQERRATANKVCQRTDRRDNAQASPFRLSLITPCFTRASSKILAHRRMTPAAPAVSPMLNLSRRSASVACRDVTGYKLAETVYELLGHNCQNFSCLTGDTRALHEF